MDFLHYKSQRLHPFFLGHRGGEGGGEGGLEGVDCGMVREETQV